MLSGPRAVVGNSGHVQLGEWVVDAEVVDVVVGNGRTDVQGVVENVALPRSSVNSERDVLGIGRLLDELEITDDEDGEVGDHRNRDLEAIRLVSGSCSEKDPREEELDGECFT